MNSARKEKLVSSHFETIFFVCVLLQHEMPQNNFFFILYLLPPYVVHIRTITSSSFIPKIIIIFVYIQTSGKCLLVCIDILWNKQGTSTHECFMNLRRNEENEEKR